MCVVQKKDDPERNVTWLHNCGQTQFAAVFEFPSFKPCRGNIIIKSWYLKPSVQFHDPWLSKKNYICWIYDFERDLVLQSLQQNAYLTKLFHLLLQLAKVLCSVLGGIRPIMDYCSVSVLMCWLKKKTKGLTKLIVHPWMNSCVKVDN